MFAAADRGRGGSDVCQQTIETWRKDETKPQRDARMAWWREAKFGNVHSLGLYSCRWRLEGKNL